MRSFTFSGFGACLCHQSAFMLVGQTFDAYRSRALSACTACSGIGVFIFPMITEFIKTKYDFTCAMIFLSLIPLIMLISVFLFRSNEQAEITTKIVTFSSMGELLKHYDFTMFCIGLLFAFIGNSLTICLLPAISRSQGMTSAESSFLVALIGASNTITVMMHGVLYDLKVMKKWIVVLYTW